MPQIDMPDIFKQYGEAFGKGIFSMAAPKMVSGFFLELLKRKRVNVKVVTRYVQEKRPLFGDISEDEQEKFRKLLKWVPNLDWLDVNWLVDTLRKDYPAVASLILGWKPASRWAEKQINLIKEEAKKNLV